MTEQTKENNENGVRNPVISTDPQPTPSNFATQSNPVLPGDELSYVPKNPFTSKTFVGLITLLITAFADKLLPAYARQIFIDWGIEFILWLTGAILIGIGRWNAARPLGTGDVKTTVVKVIAYITLALSFSTIVTTQTGCAQLQALFTPSQQPVTQDQKLVSAGQQVIQANDTFTIALQTVTLAAQTGLIDPKDLLPYEPARLAAQAALDEAQQRVEARDPDNLILAALQRFQTEYTKYLPLRSKAERAKTTKPTTKLISPINTTEPQPQLTNETPVPTPEP